MNEVEPTVVDVSSDEVTEIESLCMACHEQGTTRLLVTDIPYFRSVVLMGFECPHCGFRSSEVQQTSEVAPRGVRFELHVDGTGDTDRQVVKGRYATIKIPEIDFEIPPEAQSGTLNTVEGVLTLTKDSIELGQPVRRAQDPETAARIDEFLATVSQMAAGEQKFTLVLDDPSGNSFIENPAAPAADAHMKTTRYVRSAEQNAMLDIFDAQAEAEVAEAEAAKQARPNEESGGLHGPLIVENESSPANVDAFQKEVMELPTVCSACGADGCTRMLVTNIPHFKETVLMSFTCDKCGYKTSEVKPGGAISALGTRIRLDVKSSLDLSRDFLKSDTASVAIPEIDLELTYGTLGSKYTTVEGLLKDALEHLEEGNPFAMGDSAQADTRTKYMECIEKLRECAVGRRRFTLIVEDPIDNSYISPPPDRPDSVGGDDPQLVKEHFERTNEQNEMLGLNDIKTENYEA